MEAEILKQLCPELETGIEFPLFSNFAFRDYPSLERYERLYDFVMDYEPVEKN